MSKGEEKRKKRRLRNFLIYPSFQLGPLGIQAALLPPVQLRQDLGVWHFQGTLPCAHPPGCLGGVAEIEIRKSDGEILRVINGK